MRDKCPYCDKIISFNEVEVEITCPECKEPLSTIGVLILRQRTFEIGSKVWILSGFNWPVEGVISEMDLDFGDYIINNEHYDTLDIYPEFEDCKKIAIERQKSDVGRLSEDVKDYQSKLKDSKKRLMIEERRLKSLIKLSSKTEGLENI